MRHYRHKPWRGLEFWSDDALHRTMHAIPPSKFFPPIEEASPEGMIGFGGELSPDWLLDAYSHGIFPWDTVQGLPTWWSPDPRAVLDFENFHISRRLARRCRSDQFTLACDERFSHVLEGCASAQNRRSATWLNTKMRNAYLELHSLGHAHCVETLQNGELVGGVYGVALGAFFAAESMFYRERDASKVALVGLMAHLRELGYQLVDLQQLTPHTITLGATEISRDKYLTRLARAVQSHVPSFSPVAPLSPKKALELLTDPL